MLTIENMNEAVINRQEDMIVKSNPNKKHCSLEKVSENDGLLEYHLSIGDGDKFIPNPVILEWKVPAINVKGVWKNSVDFAKRIEADWELENLESRISINSPLISLFGNQDENVVTFACSNAINKLELGAKYREEDNNFYCQIVLFTECRYAIERFELDICIDYRKVHFSQCLQEVAAWWEGYDMQPLQVPEIARKPLYSTWYQYHQDLKTCSLVEESKAAKALGFDAMIIDDGWQTFDSNRGYDFTGDWQPDRIPNMKGFVESLQAERMKVGLWFSVPFCGKRSKAYQKFRGRFLTENHRWAPVFDPRYPEIREYLVDIYASAVRDWGLDGLKLDFIDDFRSYPETRFDDDPERDFYSINEAVSALLNQVVEEVSKINPEIFIEFRQRYVGPAIRKYGNMLRAFDCPGDYIMNRVRIADIKMLAGHTAVHSDMVTLHADEPVEPAALQVVNTLFGVPQVSVFLKKIPESHQRMVRFYMDYWKENCEVLLDGDFLPVGPLANYPIQSVSSDELRIIGVNDHHTVSLSQAFENVHLLNAKSSGQLVIVSATNLGRYACEVYNCEGELTESMEISLAEGATLLQAPACGLVKMKLINDI